MTTAPKKDDMVAKRETTAPEKGIAGPGLGSGILAKVTAPKVHKGKQTASHGTTVKPPTPPKNARVQAPRAIGGGKMKGALSGFSR